MRNLEQNSGITVIATTKEASNDRQNASASEENRNLLTPTSSVTGKKSTTSTRVAASTARFTSAPPCFGGDRRRRAHFQVAIDVFQRDDGVIDDARERQRQAAQDHGIDRAAQHVKDHESGQRGNRDGQQHREGGPHASQEDQDHEAGEHQTDHAFMEHGIQRFFHEHRLVEDDAGLQLAGEIEEMSGEIADVVHHLNGIGIAALLHDRNVGGFLAVDADDVVLQLAGVLGLADVADRNPLCAHRLQRQVVQVLDVLDQAVGVDVIVVRVRS